MTYSVNPQPTDSPSDFEKDLLLRLTLREIDARRRNKFSRGSTLESVMPHEILEEHDTQTLLSVTLNAGLELLAHEKNGVLYVKPNGVWKTLDNSDPFYSQVKTYDGTKFLSQLPEGIENIN